MGEEHAGGAAEGEGVDGIAEKVGLVHVGADPLVVNVLVDDALGGRPKPMGNSSESGLRQVLGRG